MSAERPAASVDRCECGAPADDIHFDRSICACGMAHYYCNQCGTQTEACVDESPAARNRAESEIEELTADFLGVDALVGDPKQRVSAADLCEAELERYVDEVVEELNRDA